MNKRLVVVDVDDVLLDLNKSVEKRAQEMGYFDYCSENIKTYSLNKGIDTTLLSENQRNLEDTLGCPRGLILELYKDLRCFADAKFTPNMRDGLKLLSKNFSTLIYTSSWSFDIARFKLNLFEEICSDLDLSYAFGVGTDKPVFKDVFAVFEDSLPNLLDYDSITKKILVDRPQNCELFNKNLLCQLENLVRVENFYSGVQHLLKEV